ncbi:hypothetical protein UlMin_015085 [Ulmus minor]
MGELENLLLEAAGRTGTANRDRNLLPPSKRRLVDNNNGGDSSSDEDSNDDQDYARKSSSQVPLKNKNEPTEGEDYQGSNEEGNSSNSEESDVGSDLYKNEDDRQRLEKMTELDREMILTDRACKKDDKKFKLKLKLKVDGSKSAQSSKEDSPLPVSHSLRSSARTTDKMAAMDGALNHLRERQLKKQDSEAPHKNASRGISIKQKASGTAGFSCSSEGESCSRNHSEDDRSSWGGKMDDSDEEGGIPRLELPSFDDIKCITIRRSKLVKWFMEPFFEDIIVGCFVRIGIGKSSKGPVYRLCKVQSVDSLNPDKQYKLEGKTTHKYLVCTWGSVSSAAKWQMAVVSDSAPSEEEYEEWVKEVKRNGGRMLRKQDVLEKKETLQKAQSYVYSATTVKQMLQEKKHASSRPLNIAVEKDRLRTLLEIAEGRFDNVEAKKIKTRLQELEAYRQPEKNSKAIRLAEMNKKNKAENFRNASESVNMSLKAGDAGYDPFSRRWTRSRNYYIAKVNQEGESEEHITKEDGKVTKEIGINVTTAALEAAADAGKLVDTSAPMAQSTEFNMLHNFELPISLAALQKFGGPQGAQLGYMARKQRIEATVGVQVPEDDGKKHAQTLTVSDYKRRRGLL